MNKNLHIICLLFSLVYLTNSSATAQTPNTAAENNNGISITKPVVEDSDMAEVKRQLSQQQKEIEQLREMLIQQAQIIEKLKTGATQTAQNSTVSTTVSDTSNASNDPEQTQTDTIESRLGKVEEQAKKTSESIANGQLGKLGFGGEIRMQYDSQYGLLNNAANIDNPAILGNELSPRQRLRYRLRFVVKGKIGGDVFTGAFASDGTKRTDKEFEWGVRFSSGSLSNPVSPNAILTDFFSRKPVAIDQAYVAWRPHFATGLRIIAGKFEPTWTRTEMTFDNDLQVEGISETFSRDIKNKVVKNITFGAWQLPLLERGTTFVRNANGTINLGESRRNGRDLGLYGAQLQTRFALSPKTNLTLSATDQYFANTDAINPVQVFGTNLQLPVSITIPATATTPAQTVTTVVNIPRELLVSGNGNLGLTGATNAAVGRNGRLASGFNLVDLIAQLDLKQYKYNPMTFLFDFVRNTQTRDVIVAGTNGSDVVLPNNEDTGIWAEFRFQNLRKTRGSDFNAPVKGDIFMSYTFINIEKDAVLTPFNWDDMVQQSDVRTHKLFFSYTVDPRVTFNITSIFSQRLNGFPGPFGTTPAGSLDRSVKRFQFDTVFKF
ncbi:MAG: putative porin [Pyrinomonadaceae bacterium]